MPVPDPSFSHPRLARVYDALNEPRDDLDAYLALARDLGASSLLDVGCGTGSLALLTAAAGLQVAGVDPAAASLAVARAKPGAEAVRWLEGTVADLPAMEVDLAVMTGNVAQVFLGDEEWACTLAGLRSRLATGGHLVFETRRLDDRAWQRWQDEPEDRELEVPGVGRLRYRLEVLEVDLPLVSFRQEYTFGDGPRLCSDSTLRFRDRPEMHAHLRDAGLTVVDVRDAPDRPGREDVYLARADRPTRHP